MVVSHGVGSGIKKQEIDQLKNNGIIFFDVPSLEKSSNSRKIFLCLKATLKKPTMLRYWRKLETWSRMELFSGYYIWERIRELHPDIVHIHFGHRASILANFEIKQPVVVTWHGYDVNCVPKSRGIGIYNNLFQKSWKHTVGSNFAKKRIISLGALDENVSVIPLGIDLKHFSFVERQIIADSPFKVISVGRLDEVKGHKYLIQAVSELVNSGLKLELEIIGDGPLKNELRRLVLATRNSDNIYLLGAKTSKEVFKRLKTAALFCLTGIEASNGSIETQGMVFAEAQATGLPVIGSAIGGIPESLIDQKTGFLCPPGDIQSIKNAIKFFLKNPQVITEFGREGRNFVEHKFSMINMADAFEKLYHSL